MWSATSEIKHFSTLPHIWWGARTPAGQKRYDNKAILMSQLCQVRSASRILEVGCGDGEFTTRLTRIVPKRTQIVAVDITPKAIARAKKYISQTNIVFRVENIAKMSLPSNSFDIVCGVSILHHVPLLPALAEIYRVLKRGGEIFFTEPNLLNPHTFAGLHIPSLRKKMEFSPNETAFVRWQLARQIKSVGFSRLSVKNYDFLHPHTPAAFISLIEFLGLYLEKLPLVKEISGSLVIYGRKK